MSNDEVQAVDAAKQSVNDNLQSEGISTTTREKSWEKGDPAEVTVSTQSLIETTAEEFDGRAWKRVNGLGISIRAFTERGCILDKQGASLTGDSIGDTLANLVKAGADRFEDGAKIKLKVKSVKPVLRSGQLGQRVVWQLAQGRPKGVWCGLVPHYTPLFSCTATKKMKL